MFDKELFLSANSDGDRYYHSRSKADSQKLHYKPRLSKFQLFNNFIEMIELPRH